MSRTTYGAERATTGDHPKAGGHDACQGFCPVCGAVAPCYRSRRALRLRLSGSRPAADGDATGQAATERAANEKAPVGGRPGPPQVG